MLNNRIGRKIFGYTFTTLLSIILILIVLIFYIMPVAYKYYNTNQNNSLTRQIVEEMPKNSVLDAYTYLLKNEDLDAKFVIMFPEGAPSNNVIIFPGQDTILDAHEAQKMGATSYYSENSNSPVFDGQVDNNLQFIDTKVIIDGHPFIVSFNSSGSYMSTQFYNTLVYLLPKLLILMLVVSLILVLVLTKKLSRPLLLLNQKVKEISDFNFDNNIKIDENTELGDISKELDVLSVNFKRGMESLEQTTQRAIESEKTRREFLTIMSHELKTPLTIIKGQNECMLDNRGVYQDRDKYLADNQIIIGEMEELIKRILLSLKVDDENLEIIKAECDLEQLVYKNVEYYSKLIGDKNLKVEVNVEPVIVFNDVSMLRYAVKNIIENAFFYADDNSTIYIDLTESYFQTRNKNVDLDDAKIDELFKPFKTTDSSRNKKISGTGLGLYIIRRSLEALKFEYYMKKHDDMVEFRVYLD